MLGIKAIHEFLSALPPTITHVIPLILLDTTMGTSGKVFTRRSFLASALGLGSFCTAFSHEGGNNIALAADAEPQIPRGLPVLPPGAESMEWFSTRCTGCQLCVSACPHHALLADMSGKNILQPALHFTNGYCHADCTVCSHICPTGAIRPIEPRVKKRLQLGRAVLHPDRCLVKTEGSVCTECARHCPASAIILADVQGGRMPVVDSALCTGCGACEFHCPVRPEAAIKVEGNPVQVRV